MLFRSQIEAYNFRYNRSNSIFFNSYYLPTKFYPFPDAKSNYEEFIPQVRMLLEKDPCKNCGSVLLNGIPEYWCCRNGQSVLETLP